MDNIPQGFPPHDPREEEVKKVVAGLKEEFEVMGKWNIRSWHTWLILGLAVGITTGVLLVANRSGQFEPGKAASSLTLEQAQAAALAAHVTADLKAKVALDTKATLDTALAELTKAQDAAKAAHTTADAKAKVASSTQAVLDVPRTTLTKAQDAAKVAHATADAKTEAAKVTKAVQDSALAALKQAQLDLQKLLQSKTATTVQKKQAQDKVAQLQAAYAKALLTTTASVQAAQVAAQAATRADTTVKKAQDALTRNPATAIADAATKAADEAKAAADAADTAVKKAEDAVTQATAAATVAKKDADDAQAAADAADVVVQQLQKASLIECSDGIDNDGDGLTDLKDPGCSNSADTNEHGTVACDDGIDNDGDGKIDYPSDSGCTSVVGTDENNCGNGACESGENAINCARDCAAQSQQRAEIGGNTGTARVEIQHTFIGDLVADLYVGSPSNHFCEIGVSHRQGGATKDIRRDIDLTPCAAFLPPSSLNPWFLNVVDAAQGDEGKIEVFKISIGGQIYTASGLPISIQDFSTATTFISPQCNDGIDNDNDGLIDYPNDPGCDSSTDFDERNVLNLHSSILPSSRSVQVGQAATAFATLLVSGQGVARGCGISPVSSIPATFSYQTTDPTTNQVTGIPNTPVDIAAGGGQTFVISLTPTAPFSPTDVQFSFDCDNTDPAPVVSSLNTLLLSASAAPVADIIALVATPTNNGILNIPVNGAAAFSLATSNVGASALISAGTYYTSNVPVLQLTLTICETNPANAQCKSPPASNVWTQIDAGATPTFSVFATANGEIPFDPANNRIFVTFKTSDGVIRGSTSVAVRTQ